MKLLERALKKKLGVQRKRTVIKSRGFSEVINQGRFPDIIIQYHLPSIHTSQRNDVDEKLVVIGRKLLLAGLSEATLNLCLADKAGF